MPLLGEIKMNEQQIIEIARIPESAFRFKVYADRLVEFYRFIREQWTPQAIKQFSKDNSLDLRRYADKLQFAWLAAREWVNVIPASSEHQQIPSSPQSQVVRVLSQAPAYRIMGEPIYYDELRRNYLYLSGKFHPDRNKQPEARARFQLVTAIYKDLQKDWFVKYSPLIATAKIGQENIDKALAKQFPFSPESFWE
jgi:hypothetical protein